MERLFSTHKIRKQISLDGMWDFQTVDLPQLPESYSDRIAVPSCWEMTITYCNYCGFAAYRREIEVENDCNLRLNFKGISHSGTVFFDGEKIGFHYNAFTPFSLVVPAAAKGRHTLEVIADNHFSDQSTLHIPNDYFTYGGITRPVFAEQVADCYIERTEFEPKLIDGKWMADIRIFIKNIGKEKAEIEVKLSGAGNAAAIKGEAQPGETKLCTELAFEDVQEWSEENPALYLMTYELSMDGNVVDDLIDRVGFRVVKTVGNKLTLNGKTIFLKGFNRHEDHGIAGCAMSLQDMNNDLALIKDMGGNAVRTCHYPNDERFLDLCDEKGIYVWEESHARGLDEEQMINPLFIKQSSDVTMEMLNYHYNHPSIIIWGCLNECQSDTEPGREIYIKHFDMLNKDKSRPNTFACNKLYKDLCLDLESICSFNIYPYWYGEESPAENMVSLDKWLDSEPGYNGKPVIISEFGAGGIYGFRDVMMPKWSEEYQAYVIDESIRAYADDERVAGMFIWQFCDTRVTQQIWPMRRPKSRNNKGVVDEYRRPKLAYEAVKKQYREIDR